MAIQPIQQVNDPSQNLLQVVQGGQNTISSILDRAISIGRDMNDRRMRQEQDMSAMRLQEQNLAQRRADNLQDQIFGAQKFARGAYENDRAYDAQQRQTDVLNRRQDQQFDEGVRRFDVGAGFQERSADRADRQLKATTGRYEAENRQRQEVSDLLNRRYAGDGAPAAQNSTPFLQAAPQDFQRGDGSLLSTGPRAAAPPTQDSYETLLARKEQLEEDRRIAEKFAPSVASRIAQEEGRVQGQIDTLGKPMSLAQRSTEERQLAAVDRATDAENRRQESARIERLRGERSDTAKGLESQFALGSNVSGAFTNPEAQFDTQYGEALKQLDPEGKGKVPQDLVLKKTRELAEKQYGKDFKAANFEDYASFQRDPAGREVASVLRHPTRKAFVEALPNATEEQKRIRGEFYDEVRKRDRLDAELSGLRDPNAPGTPAAQDDFTGNLLKRINSPVKY